MDKKTIESAEKVLSRFPVYVRFPGNDSEKRKPKELASRAKKLTVLLDPAYYCQQYELQENVKMFLQDLRAAIGEEATDELYATCLAEEWPGDAP